MTRLHHPIFNVCMGSSITATIRVSVRYIYISTLLETFNNYAGLNLIIFIGIMGIGTITLNLLYSELLGGMIMANKTLTELTVESILDAGSKRAFLVTYVVKMVGFLYQRCRGFKSLTLLTFLS